MAIENKSHFVVILIESVATKACAQAKETKNKQEGAVG